MQPLEDQDCPICLERYDNSLHLPRIVPLCGHTLCSQCVTQLLESSPDFICPIDKKEQSGSFPSIDSFHPNFALIGMIEKTRKFGLCKDHKKELQYFCVKDEVKVCNGCALFGEHRGHNIKTLSDLKPEIKKKIQQLHEESQKLDNYQADIQKIYEDQRERTHQEIRSKFQDLRFLIDIKEAELQSQIDPFYDKEIDKVCLEIAQTRKVIKTKLSEYHQQINQDSHLWDLFQDVSARLNIIEEALSPDPELINKTKQYFQKVQADLDSVFSNQLAALEKVDYSECLHLENNLKLDEKLSFIKEEFQPLSPNLVQISSSDFAVEEEQLNNSNPFDVCVSGNINILGEIGGNITSLQFKISKDLEEICQEDFSKFLDIRNKLPFFNNIDVLIKDHKISDQALFHVLSFLFPRNDRLKQFSIVSDTGGLFEKSIFYLSENILPFAPFLENIAIDFLNESQVSPKALSSINKSISRIAKQLTSLSLTLPCKDADENSMRKLFVRMPNLEHFAYQFPSMKSSDKVMMTFLSKTLPWLKNLTSFRLIMSNSTVTNWSVKKLLSIFPKEWFRTLNTFQVSLENTGICDKCLEDFVYQSLRKFENLTEFEINMEGSFFSQLIRQRVSEWERNLSRKQ